MAPPGEWGAPDGPSQYVSTTGPARALWGSRPAIERPRTPTIDRDLRPRSNGRVGGPNDQPNIPTTPTPSRSVAKRATNATTPRLKKRVPWKTKSVMVLLPRDEERGLPGKAQIPLKEAAVNGMLRSWQQLGYDTEGFDLYPQTENLSPRGQSQSRGAWPDFGDLARERKQGGWKVLLPDLNAWKEYVDELNEAKLRALGVSFGDEDPPPPSISPTSTMAQYPALPFSPPVPPSSASSNLAMPGFPFPSPFATSATQSPGIPAGVSPGPFPHKLNPRASVSIPSPHAWSPQMMLQQGHRVGSPSLANLSAMMSPTSPFSADGMPGSVGHQRHQSLQYSTLNHQFQPPARASPRLQELREVEEEAPIHEPSNASDPASARLNASDSLQQEIDEAEYHLEEQMRSQLDNDEDYSPHNENDMAEAAPMSSSLTHAGEPLVQFAPQPPQFAGDTDGVVLHHPRPHSRGHSLSQKYFTEDDVSKEGGNFRPSLQQISAQPAEDSEIETNPSNLGTPVRDLDLSKLMHQRAFSTASNPWTDNDSGKSASGSRQVRPGHGSKSSFSKLNVAAPEFKFNPTSNFQPGAFTFPGPAFQPTSFNMGLNQTESGHPSLPTAKINANAPVSSPGQSHLSLANSGLRFRPDAPAFMPQHSVPASVTSPVMSGAESGSNRASAIFGNIDLASTDIAKTGKKSTPVPIVRPGIPESTEPSGMEDGPDGRPVIDDSRIKRARGKADDDDAVPLFAEPIKGNTLGSRSRLETPAPEDSTPLLEEKSFDESNLGHPDTAMSSTIVSEATDTKTTVSPSETSPVQTGVDWAPFEFKSAVDMQAFNEAVPFGNDPFRPTHKKSLSATAKAFVPSAATWTAPAEQAADATSGQLTDQPVGQSGATLNTLDELADVALGPASKDEVAESIEKTADEQMSPTPATARAPVPVVAQGRSTSQYAGRSPPVPPKRTGLAASRFAATPSPGPDDEPRGEGQIISPLAADTLPTGAGEKHAGDVSPIEPTMADIDEVMRRLNENPDMGVNRTFVEQLRWHEPSPTRHSPNSAASGSSPSHLPSQTHFRSDAPSPSLGDYRQPALMDLEDPFIDPPQFTGGAIHRLNGSESLPASDWEGVFSEGEQTKLESRVAFFDGRVNQLLGGLLAARLGPLEQTLGHINHALVGISRRAPSSRERSSISAEVRESDADDEDDDVPATLRSMSPRRDRRMEQIRVAVLDAFATQLRNQPREPSPAPAPLPSDNSIILKTLEEIKERFSQPVQPPFPSEEIKNIVEEVVERCVPPAPEPVKNDDDELRTRIAELEQRVRAEETRAEAEISARRAAENRMAETDRELQSASTRIEVEMMNKTALNQRIADLEDRAHRAEHQSEEEVKGRKAAEDRLSEVQRLLRISSEEETRLREVVGEKERALKSAESAHSESAVRLALLETNHVSSQQSQSEAQNRANALEAEAREARKDALHWRAETDRIVRITQQRDKDLAHVRDENKAIHKLLDTLGTQLQENERVRDSYRTKFISLQDDMAQATREITEENARRTKKEHAMLARQEVLEARLQAEARTRERIETELERLEMGERQGMRAVAECKRLETILAEMRTENHNLHLAARRYQAEFQEARESGAREVQRTREAMQSEVEGANHQVNVVREELEDQVARLRSQLDQVKLDADTAKARHEMLLEEAQNSKQADVEELLRKQQNEIEDLQVRYERQLSNITEHAQRAEQNLLERLSISTSKSEHLQDKVAHLEDKLEIAKEAGRAAAQAAKSVASSETVFGQAKTTVSRQLELPEKISPQALRESIMVLQEQLQEREQRIEELEGKLSKADPDAETKISKRDDEIIWLRELLAVRHSDLQDIIGALGREDYDKNAVKDAAIRLKANLQMEEQERERAMNGGSAINLPNIAATIRDAATPRVAQAVGPLAAAWGNWRKTRDRASSSGVGSVLSSPALVRNSTPSRSSSSAGSGGSFLGGLLTPPASRMQQQQTPTAQTKQPQPTAFASTGRRFTAQDLANRPRPPPTASTPPVPGNSNQTGKAAMAAVQETPSPPRRAHTVPVTPPMMRSSAYDSDAQAEDFDDAGFFEDDD
ncbi:hypothetical protein BT67DRAFT_391952 [Trichocladium antarcticum]|uniref:Myosin class II heavy chain n=1 Tax=Trichocladium antarcticum TaxID=1450529 RepID=A0AAN6UCE7_9PEZI|nr:hypothetical protein BT67DRAFT_391952 [Trichocladium antarcticum]